MSNNVKLSVEPALIEDYLTVLVKGVSKLKFPEDIPEYQLLVRIARTHHEGAGHLLDYLTNLPVRYERKAQQGGEGGREVTSGPSL